MAFDEIICTLTLREVRDRVNLAGFVQSFLGRDKSRCRVLDLSADGARLDVGRLEVGPRFTLHIPERGTRRECRVVWQHGNHVGVHFVERA
jgi:hypothetical protein